jgi:hypothetical protein
MRLVIALLLVSVVLAAGCSAPLEPSIYVQKKSVSDIAASACISACRSALSSGQDLSSGPCLSNEIAAGWVCDVAHNPRQDIDNQRQNQCSAFPGSASHFIEVDPDCNLIRTV